MRKENMILMTLLLACSPAAFAQVPRRPLPIKKVNMGKNMTIHRLRKSVAQSARHSPYGRIQMTENISRLATRLM